MWSSSDGNPKLLHTIAPIKLSIIWMSPAILGFLYNPDWSKANTFYVYRSHIYTEQKDYKIVW